MPIQPVSGEIKAQPLNENFSYLDSKVDQVNGGPKEVFTSESALKTKYPNGSTSVMLVTDSNGNDGYLYSWNGSSWIKGVLYQPYGIPIGSVSTAKLADLIQGKNLFNKDTTTDGYYIGTTDGKLYASSSLFASNYVIITGNKPIVFSSLTNTTINIAYYSDVDSFLSGAQIASSNTNRSVTPPSNAKLMRVSTSLSQKETMQIEFGTIATEYEKFYQYNPNLKRPGEDDPAYIEEPSQLRVGVVTTEKLGDLVQGKNLFNPRTMIQGYYVGQTDGSLVANGSYFAVQFCSVLPESNYTFSPKIANSTTINYVFFDKRKQFISGSGGQITSAKSHTVTVPPNAYYISYSAHISMSGSFQFEKGDTETEYEKFYQYNPNIVEPKDGDDTSSNGRKTIVKMISETEIRVYVPTSSGDNDYIAYNFLRIVRPYTGSTDENCDLWRIYGVDFVTLDETLSVSFLESVCSSGAFECAISAEGYEGFIGTYHGYEFQNSFRIYTDGVSRQIATVETYLCDEVKIIHMSNLIRHGTENEEVANVVRIYKFSREKFNLYQKYIWTGAYSQLKQPYLTMLPILRKSASGKQITDTAFSEKDWVEYDVAEAGTSYDINQQNPDIFSAYIYGKESKYSAEVSLEYEDKSKTNLFNLSPSENYNKFYFSYNALSSVEIGDIWEINTEFRINKAR